MAARRARALARVTHLEAQKLRYCKPYKATPREACATDVIEEGWVVKIQWYRSARKFHGFDDRATTFFDEK